MPTVITTGEVALPRKIPLHVVVQKIQNRQINETETRKLFAVAPNPAKPFDFNIRFNTDTVDTSNAPSAHQLAAPLLRDAGIGMQFKRLPTAPKSTKKFSRKLPLIAEGDSWFNLPDVHPPVPRTLIDFLQSQLSTVNLAHWGDTLADMILIGQFWRYLQSGSSDVFLFSGGGNDVLGGGELWRFLELFDVDHARPKDAAYYLNQDFYDNLNVIISAYERLINAIKLRAPHVVMLGHGYDYAIPRIDGPWLGGPMTRQGIDPIDHAELGEAIVRLIIDTFNNRLKALEKSHGNNFRHIDLRGTIKRREWWDELHPFEVGAKKTAAKYLSAIRELPASSEVQEAPFDAYFNRLVA
jgi:hypothetical protein